MAGVITEQKRHSQCRLKVTGEKGKWNYLLRSWLPHINPDHHQRQGPRQRERERGLDGNGRGNEKAVGKSILKLQLSKACFLPWAPWRWTIQSLKNWEFWSLLPLASDTKVETWHHKCHSLLDQTLFRFLWTLFSTRPCLLGTVFIAALSILVRIQF